MFDYMLFIITQSAITLPIIRHFAPALHHYLHAGISPINASIAPVTVAAAIACECRYSH
jgi:hypothetical protein